MPLSIGRTGVCPVGVHISIGLKGTTGGPFCADEPIPSGGSTPFTEELDDAWVERADCVVVADSLPDSSKLDIEDERTADSAVACPH